MDRRIPIAVILSLAVASAGCNLLSDPSTTPSTNTTATFAGTLAQQGSNLFTFTVSQAGTVSVTLTSLSATVAVGLGIGTPSGTTTCALTSSTSTAFAGSTPQIMVTEDPGMYCVKIYDVGNLASTSTFSITIVHP